MTSNAEKALSYAMSLAHATAGNGIRRTTEQIVDEARAYKSFLDEGDDFSEEIVGPDGQYLETGEEE